jgi:hypothetical protein
MGWIQEYHKKLTFQYDGEYRQINVQLNVDSVSGSGDIYRIMKIHRCDN